MPKVYDGPFEDQGPMAVSGQKCMRTTSESSSVFSTCQIFSRWRTRLICISLISKYLYLMPVLDLQKKQQVENTCRTNCRTITRELSVQCKMGDGSHGFIVTYGSNPLRQRVLVSGIICLFLKLSFMCLNFKDLCQSVQMLVECSLIFVNLLENT